jgi:hypothetical protein
MTLDYDSRLSTLDYDYRLSTTTLTDLGFQVSEICVGLVLMPTLPNRLHLPPGLDTPARGDPPRRKTLLPDWSGANMTVGTPAPQISLNEHIVLDDSDDSEPTGVSRKRSRT